MSDTPLSEPKRGMRFLHARQLVKTPGVPVSQWPRETCEVTRVTATSIYFRNSTGFKSVVARDKFQDAVSEVLA